MKTKRKKKLEGNKKKKIILGENEIKTYKEKR